jgi:hypothetical protein
MRLLMLASIGMAGLFLTELGAAAKLWSMQRLPSLPNRFGPSSSAQKSGELYLVVIGESSARGEPYHPWLSVGQIVGWQLERVFPSKRIDVDVRAEGGLCLEQAVLLLAGLERRPDAIVVFAGHNEFTARFGWLRNVRHYVDGKTERLLALKDLAKSSSSTLALIIDSLDRLRGSAPPPRNLTRALVEHPSFATREFAFLLEDFRRRVDHVGAYCRRIDSLPILIVPASNDGAFEPSRSVLAASTSLEERASFERAFQAARATEAGDPEKAREAYRCLLERHPEFAEAHYRFADLLCRTGRWVEARHHFVAARDLDGLILRCPSDFQEAVRTAARRYDAVLIDGPMLISRLSPHGISDDHFFHDAQHLNLTGYVALAQDLLEQLHARRAFGWPTETPVPRIDLAECADQFGLDAAKWSEVCVRSAYFYQRTAFVRYDPTQRSSMARRYSDAARELAAGHSIERLGLTSFDIGIAIPGRQKGPADRPPS